MILPLLRNHLARLPKNHVMKGASWHGMAALDLTNATKELRLQRGAGQDPLMNQKMKICLPGASCGPLLPEKLTPDYLRRCPRIRTGPLDYNIENTV